MSQYMAAALKLHAFMVERFWDGEALIGPDNSVRFNRRVWRFVKSYLSFLPWRDSYYYVQGQGYWVLDNYLLHDLLGEQRFADLAGQCAQGLLKRQQPEGYWDYPAPGWAGRIATVECVFGGLGLLAGYERTGDPALLAGVFRWYDFLENGVGFVSAGDGRLAVKYFAGVEQGMVPNNSTLVLAFLGRLAAMTGDDRYLHYAPGLIAFLAWAQLESGELPYSLKTPGQAGGRDRIHFQCYQYHAFELQDLAMYYEDTQDASVLPMIVRIAEFIAPSVKADGSTKFDCQDSGVRMPYNTIAIAAALGIARRMGLYDASDAEERAYRFALAQQQPDGGFPFSSGDYRLLSDRRNYPRPLAMILYHLLLKAGEVQAGATSGQRETT